MTIKTHLTLHIHLARALVTAIYWTVLVILVLEVHVWTGEDPIRLTQQFAGNCVWKGLSETCFTFQAQTFTIMSCWFPTLTMYLPLGENATQEMPYLCICSSATCLRSATSHSLTAGRWPLWWREEQLLLRKQLWFSVLYVISRVLSTPGTRVTCQFCAARGDNPWTSDLSSPYVVISASASTH